MKKILQLILFLIGSLVFAQDKTSTNESNGQCISGNCQNGFGVKKFDSGTLYIGEFWDDIPSGNGTVIWSNGSIYVGDFIRGEYKGEGTFISQDSNNNILYVGEFDNNKPNGLGTMFFENQEFFVGNFKSGEFNGKGYFHNSNQTIEEGLWKKGEIIGDTAITRKNYIIFE